jgi:hypothetical protein
MKIQDIAGIQQIDDKGTVHYLTVRPSGGQVTIRIERADASYEDNRFSSEHEILNHLLNIIRENCAVCDNDKISILKAGNDIAKNTHRAQGTQIDNLICYVGNSSTDAGIIVFHNEDKTAWNYFLTPNWHEYYINIQ